MNDTNKTQKSLFANKVEAQTVQVKKPEEAKNISDQENHHHKQIQVDFGHDENHVHNKKKYGDNTIRTTKFNILTWIPLSLLFQFQRAANIYFLVISILTMLYFSPKSPVSMIGTFAVVLVFTMLKDGYEDLKRYQQDKKINERKAKVYSRIERKFVEVKWQDIIAGDIVMVENDEDIPADILLLFSSNDSGICFIDTMSLDGETNLKQKLCPKQKVINTKASLPDHSKNDTNLVLSELNSELSQLNGSITCEAPSADLLKWNCSLDVKSQSQLVEMKQLLLKGCVLKNTSFIIGLTVYTGHHTKIMKNAKKPPIKISNVMKVMNYLLYSVFAFQQVLCITFSILYINWQKEIGYLFDYLAYWDAGVSKRNSATAADGFIKYLTFVVAYSHLIPISLYVALELLKMIQSLLVGSDVEMYDKITGKYASARTSDLIEELGQVEFVFSDKTGTLTKNEMEFRKCDINFKIYGGSEYCLANGSNDPDLNRRKSDLAKRSIDQDTRAWDILNSSSNDSDKYKIYSYFELLSVCHAAHVETKNGTEIYQSSSPDEVALILGAEKMGFKFMKRTTTTIEITDYQGKYLVYDLFLELPFDSTRKRMSVIVKKDNQYTLLTKGADNVMMNKFNLNEIERTNVQKSIDTFATLGLRTLAMGRKIVEEKEVFYLREKMEKVKMKGGEEEEESLRGLYDEMEINMDYVGCSAIEDKLQDGVAETIESLMNANIRVWVLTGDKKETAIEIGKSCKLVLSEDKMEMIDLASSFNKVCDIKEFRKNLDDVYKKYCRWLQGLDINEINLDMMPKKTKKIGIIIDGANMSYVLKDLTLRNIFFKVGLVANSVICCRMSPEQKSEIVGLTKSSGRWITLAIGDGSNDVPMIMKAHVGVGVSGKEGTEAVRSADYAISQFQFLRRLLLVHGRWGYRRVSFFICYYFYKNIILVLTEFYFAIYNGFSGQIFFPDMLPLCYNAFWSSWPCIFNYSLDKDVSDHLSVNLPTLYKAGQRKFYFNMKNFWIWICQAIIHGGLIYFGTMYSLNNFLSNDGLTKDHWFRSTAAFSSIMHVINYKVFINIRHWNKVSFVVLFLSLAFYYLTLLILSIPGMAFSLNNELTHMLFQNFSYFKVWIVIICLPLIALLPDMTLNWIQLNFFPSPADIVAANPEAFEEYIKTRPLDKELELVNTGHKNGHGEIKNYSLEPSEYMNYRK